MLVLLRIPWIYGAVTATISRSKLNELSKKIGRDMGSWDCLKITEFAESGTDFLEQFKNILLITVEEGDVVVKSTPQFKGWCS